MNHVQETENTRSAAVAGMFYPAKKQALERQLNSLFKNIKGTEKSNAIIAPHAGYEYSGRIAALAFNCLEEAKTFVILGPNHTGMGAQISISTAGAWETPLGIVPVDKELRENLISQGIGTGDEEAHLQEHSIEVEIPFLQFKFREFKILPICIMSTNLAQLTELGNALAKAKNISLIASSDFSHFIPLESAKERDLKAIKFIEKLDLRGFFSYVEERKLSICGYAPIITAIQYAKQKGYSKAKLLEYNSSATATKDEMNVVAYAAIKFEK